MQRETPLVKADVALRREGVACGPEHGETRGILAHADVVREEAGIVARLALEDAAHAGGHRRVRGGEGYSCNGGVARAEERVQVRACERRRQAWIPPCRGGRRRLIRGGSGEGGKGSTSLSGRFGDGVWGGCSCWCRCCCGICGRLLCVKFERGGGGGSGH